MNGIGKVHTGFGHAFPFYWSLSEILLYLLKLLDPGDIVITLGAGDIWQLGEQLRNRLKELP